MKKLDLVVFFTIIFFMSCKNEQNYVAPSAPACIKDLIIQISKEPVRNPAAIIIQYQYKNMTVYYIPPFCCDMFGVLMDDQCNVICLPDGGIVGNGDGSCSDFAKKATHRNIIWEDDRK